MYLVLLDSKMIVYLNIRSRYLGLWEIFSLNVFLVQSKATERVIVLFSVVSTSTM